MAVNRWVLDRLIRETKMDTITWQVKIRTTLVEMTWRKFLTMNKELSVRIIYIKEGEDYSEMSVSYLNKGLIVHSDVYRMNDGLFRVQMMELINVILNKEEANRSFRPK